MQPPGVTAQPGAQAQAVGAAGAPVDDRTAVGRTAAPGLPRADRTREDQRRVHAREEQHHQQECRPAPARPVRRSPAAPAEPHSTISIGSIHARTMNTQATAGL
ncbi:hypothetical protein SHKM778_43120 [Streptomyces sp. KM77-8]|uniref:Uncharacterized protein n=1 Tax=Streptomyces haneummycinicus TaxID=3074435 RepID=A0AAT9HK74_9ACTN